MSEPRPNDLRSSKLPWIIAATALILYLATMNRWLTLASLEAVGKAGGWYWWIPNLGSPLTHLVTLPFQALPAVMIPLALNCLSVVLAALTLGQLARTVILLPQDRTREQRQSHLGTDGLLALPGKWIPPVLAVALCGFQMTFWENAIAFTGEMLNLFIFALVIRCVLEHRISDHGRWLSAALLLYGAGIANNWAMIGFLPLFGLAVIRLENRSLLSSRRILTVLGLGSAGLLLYFLMPTINHFAGASEDTWWEMFRYQFLTQKARLLGSPKYVLVILSLTSLFPLLTLCVKWPSNAGDTNPFSQGMSAFVFHLIHAMFLGLCVWVFFDPLVSPREVGGGGTYLTFYYLSALCAGYYAGYFLVVCSKANSKKWQKESPLWKVSRVIIVPAVWLTTFTAPAALTWLNLPRITAYNTPVFENYAARIADSLPTEPSIVISFKPELLVMTAAALERVAPGHEHLLVDARYLGISSFHGRMRRKEPNRWPEEWAQERFPHGVAPSLPPLMIRQLATAGNVTLLHPAAGQIWLEPMQLIQDRFVYRLKARSGKTIGSAPPSETEVEQAIKHWAAMQPMLNDLASLKETESLQAAFSAQQCSAHLTFHGVQLLRGGREEEAEEAFAAALELNPENLSAEINLASIAEAIDEEDSKFDFADWRSRLADQSADWNYQAMRNGPVDAAPALYQQGIAYIHRQFFRQAAISLIRARDKSPANIRYRLALAELFVRAQVPDLASTELQAADRLKEPELADAAITLEITRLQAMVRYLRGDLDEAVELLTSALKEQPAASVLQRSLSNLYLLGDMRKEAIASLKAQLKLNSDDTHALLNLGALEHKSERHDEALKHYERLLKITPNNSAARINRALVYMSLKRHAEAIRDLNRVQTNVPQNPLPVYYLAIIALEQNDKVTARKRLNEFLKLSPSGSEVANRAVELLEDLEADDN